MEKQLVQKSVPKKSIEIVEGQLYESLAVEWQFQMIQVLKETLRRHKVDPKKAKEICGDFAFDMSMLLDQGEIEDFRPVVCFDNLRGKLLYNSDEHTQLHDSAYASTDEAFEE